MDPVSRIVEPEPIEEVVPEPTEKLREATTLPDDIEPPLLNYQEIKGRPYTVDFFKLDFWGALTPETDVEGFRGKVHAIEQHVQSEILKRQFESTTDSYREIMNEMIMGMNLSPNELSESKVSKVAKFITSLTTQNNRKDKYKKLRHRIYGWGV